MDKLAAIFNGFVGEIRGLKPMDKGEIQKLESRDLRVEHNWAHRYSGSMSHNPKWGKRVGWNPAKLKKTHDQIVSEAKERGVPWAANHKSPLFIRHKRRE